MRIMQGRLLLVCLLAAAVAGAQEFQRDDTASVSQGSTAERNPVEALAWLVGGTWSADARLPDGSSATIEAIFEWASHKRALKYSIVKRSAGRVLPTLDGICAWHPTRKTLMLWEVDQDGNLTESTLRAEGSRVSYDEVIHGADGSALPVRAEAVREGDNRFVFRASVEKGGTWPVVFEAAYTRIDSN